MTLIASSNQRSYPSELSKLPPHHYGVFQGTLQKPHLQILGSLLFCYGLTLSEPAWSVPQVGSAALSVSSTDQKKSVVVTTTSTEAIPSHLTKQGTGNGERRTEQWGFSFPSSPSECMGSNPHPEPTRFPVACSPFPLKAFLPGAIAKPTHLEPQPLDGNNTRIGKGDKEIAANTIPVFLGQPASNSVAKITQQQQGNSTTPSLLAEIKSIPSPVENGNSISQPVQPVTNTQQKNTEFQEFSTSVTIWTFGTTGVGGTIREFISQSPGESKDSVTPFQTELEFSSEGMSEKLLLTRLPTDDPPKSPFVRGTLSGSVPPLKRGTETLSRSVPPVISKAQPPLTPPLTRGARGDQTLSNISQTSSERNSELFVQSQSFPGENTPESEQEQTGSSEDPELGILRLQELPTPPPPAKPAVYLLGGAGYFRSNNIFSALDPVDDGLFRAGVTLLAVPSLGPQTSVFASVGGNIIRYSDFSDYNYDELRFSAGIRQQIGSRTYGELGWLNRHLFSEEGGDRFLNDHSVYLELGRTDPLTRQLALNTYYQLRLSFANPSDRSQVINSLGASLAYYPFPALEAALDYQFARADFTQQERDDQYHQLIARLTYTLSRNSRFYLFGGRSFGDSSDEYTDFDGWVFGAGVDLNLVLF